jgi:HAMP domain-containing protein
MSTRQRATFGAIAVAIGLLMVVGGSISKSTEVLKHARDVERGKADARPPDPTGENVAMVLGWLLAAAGAVLVGLAIRDMTRQISDIQSRVEIQMRGEAAVKQDPKPKA